MAHIEFLDETLRDGQQSLWGMQMRCGMALPIAPTLDKTGFRVIDLTGSSMFEVLIRVNQENPWEGLKLLTQAMPNTPIRGGMRANASVTFGVTPDALMDLWMRQLNEHGCRSFWIYDVLFNIDKMHRLAKVAKEYGSEVAGAVMFTSSPVHTDEYYAQKTREVAASPDVDTVLLYDTAGVLDKERMVTLVPTVIANANGKPVEFHSNNILGMSGKAYCDAIDLGITILHTASRPMANGPSVPSTEIMTRNVELMGHTHDIDTRLLAPVAEHFEKVGKAAGFLINQHHEYDVLSASHQIPGGMIGTLRAQMAKHKLSHRMDEVLMETAKVRAELGYPGMATPFSQLVGTQAVLNMVSGERYKIVPDEVVQYAAGFYGDPVAPIDQDIFDRIMSAPRAKKVAARPPSQPTLEELEKEYGTRDPKELILRALMPESDLRKMRESGPVQRSYPLLSSPELQQANELMKMATASVVQIESEKMSMTLRR
ncbi:MAG: hypothetical protein V2I26_15775 [Halieaceae bacterium]|jgi:oxaloacetate decarboxylase alpha subunit|nr:hypothetical protein [Halieaceae bacterium]